MYKKMSSSQEKSTKELVEDIKKNYDYVMMTVTDMNGIPRCKTFPSRHASMLLEDGTQAVDIMALFGPRNEIIMFQKCLDTKFGNCILVADPSSFHDVPWLGRNKNAKFCELFCEMTWLDGEPMEMIPRHMAVHQLEELDKMDLKFYSAGEHEFRLFKEDKVTPAHSGKDMFLPSYVFDYQDLFVDLERYLSQAGVDIEYFNTEFGRGQIEIPLRPQWGIKGADHSAIMKETVRQVAKIHRLRASFMTKVYPNDISSGCHFNHSVWTKKGKNAFYDESKPDKISDLGRYWIGGLMRHCGALLALCSPTVNCYRRLHTPWAPDLINWNFDDRFVTIRVKNTSESGCYMENRLPGSAANPYLALAGTIAAGLDGIRNKLEPPPANSNELGKLPHTLEEALKVLEEDKVFVETLGPEFVQWFTQMKRDADLTLLKDVDITKDRDEDYVKEREEYFDFI